MKIRTEIDDTLGEEEVIIRCRQFNRDIVNLQKVISQALLKERKLSFEKEGKEYYLSVDEILFFETQDKRVYVHTVDNVYQSRYKLYELEEMLPHYFLRVSKSTILNVEQIYSINWNLSSSSMVEFQHTHKRVFVSRVYCKVLKEILENRKESGGD